ncbi:MAG TPA: acetyl-CoA carboxylase carboxyltransferase subunit alpha [Pyrinomonadaceae bacterium]
MLREEGSGRKIAPLNAMPSEQLSAIERVRIARHPERPYVLDLVEHIFDEFVEVHGDRRYAEDPALVCGLASYHGKEVTVIGQQKGRDTKQRRYRNFGMPKPEGYRKALRLMRLAEKFNRPILTFVDTPGAYPGIDAEERGQAEAIAKNLLVMAKLKVAVIVTIVGEGGSGGALAIGVGDAVLMLENAIYSVISPEGCAAILWKDSNQSALAAESLKLTAQDLNALGVVDRVVAEPAGGAHADVSKTAQLLDSALGEFLKRQEALSDAQRQALRYKKLRALGFTN